VHELDAMLTGMESRIVLVEPDADRADELRARFQGDDRVTVIAKGVATSTGDAELHVFNFPGLRSLLPPKEGLRGVLPGLRLRASKPVELITPAQLLNELGDLPLPWSLYVDVASWDSDILQGLLDCGAMYRAELVRVRCAATSFFEGLADSSGLQEWAIKNGFVVADIDEADPDFPRLTLSANAISHVAHLTKRIDDLSAEHQRQQNLNAIARADLQNLQARYASSEKARAKQEELLQKLAPRLRQVMEEVATLHRAPMTGGVAQTSGMPSVAPKPKSTRGRRTPSGGKDS